MVSTPVKLKLQKGGLYIEKGKGIKMLNSDWKYDEPRKGYYFNEEEMAEHNKQIREDAIDEILMIVKSIPKECDCDFDLKEKISKSKIIEAIENLKE